MLDSNFDPEREYQKKMGGGDTSNGGKSPEEVKYF